MKKRVLTYGVAAVLAAVGAGLLVVSLERETSAGEASAVVATEPSVDDAATESNADEESGTTVDGETGVDVAATDDTADVDAAAGDSVGDLAAVAPPSLSSVEVSPRLVQISFALDTERSFSGQLRPGDLVGVFASYDDGEATDLILQKVLVSAVREEAPLAIDSGDVDRLPAAPVGRFFITLALSANDAETLAHALEFGRIWLAYEPGTADENAPGIATRDTVLTEPLDESATDPALDVVVDGAGA